jgi:hypothetical protein
MYNKMSDIEQDEQEDQKKISKKNKKQKPTKQPDSSTDRDAGHINEKDKLHYTRAEIQEFIDNPKGTRESNDKFKGMWEREIDGVVEVGKDIGIGKWASIVPVEDIQKKLAELYQDPKTGLTGMNKFYDRVKDTYIGITSEDCYRFLRAHEGHQIHQGIPSAKVTRPVVIKQPNKYLQIDLSDMSEYKGYNQGYRYILSAVDVNSKFLYAKALKNKTSKNVAAALEKILDEMLPKRPSVAQHDNGSEFMAEVSELLKSRGIKQIFSLSHNPRSQGQIERVQQTLKRMIRRHFTQENTRRWFDILDQLLENYNSTTHNTTKEKPEIARDAKPDEQKIIANKITTAAQKSIQKDAAPLKVGDFVRISLVKHDPEQRKLYSSGKRKKASAVNWTKTIYQIERVNQGKAYAKETYKLKTLPGVYYRYSLLKTVAPEEVIRSEKPNQDFQKLDQEYQAGEAGQEEQEALLEKHKEEPVASRTRSKKKG